MVGAMVGARAWLEQLTLWVWLTRSVRGFVANEGMLRASGLTYTTLLSMVPLLAVVLSLLKGAGFAATLGPFLRARFPMLDESATEALLAYIDRANAQSIGGLGLIGLLLSAWILLHNTEVTLNRVFGVSEGRGWARRASEYLAMLVVGTAVIASSISVQALLARPDLLTLVLGERMGAGAAGWALYALPWLTTWGGFTLLYAWMPSAVLPLRWAAAGGLLASVGFQAVQLAYLNLQFGFARYHAIYGALAQLPILLTWVYASWVMVLVGAEAVAAARSLGRSLPSEAPRLIGGATLSLEVLRQVLAAFASGRPTPDAAEMALRLGMTPREAQEAAEVWIRAGFLCRPGPDHGYLPARSPASISLADVESALRPAPGGRPDD